MKAKNNKGVQQSVLKTTYMIYCLVSDAENVVYEPFGFFLFAWIFTARQHITGHMSPLEILLFKVLKVFQSVYFTSIYIIGLLR
jgi:hypothetical protein